MTDRRNENQIARLLGEILDVMRFRGTVFFHSKLNSPWGMEYKTILFPRFHIALEGNCYVGKKNGRVVAIEKGEIIMLPVGSSHWIADSPESDLMDGDLAAEGCLLGGLVSPEDNITNKLLCGVIKFDEEVRHPLLGTLPQFLHFMHNEISQNAWHTASLIDSEIEKSYFKNNPIIDRLSEVLFLQLLVVHITQSECETGFSAALQDPRILHALELIHASPGTNWTVESLGKEIGMSRATLNRHFKNTIGDSPMVYIQNWRLAKAFSMVKHSTHTLEDIAETVGYSSARTLNKAFVRNYGLTPSQIRKNKNEYVIDKTNFSVN